MKVTFTVLVAAVLSATGAMALPAAAYDSNQRFTCPERVNDFCHASNIKSGCAFGGTFKSNAMDTCGACTCVN